MLNRMLRTRVCLPVLLAGMMVQCGCSESEVPAAPPTTASVEAPTPEKSPADVAFEQLVKEATESYCCDCDLDAARELLKQYPDHPELLGWYARQLFTNWEWVEAEQVARSVLQRTDVPKSSRAWTHLTLARIANGRQDFTAVKAHCDAAIALDARGGWNVTKSARGLRAWAESLEKLNAWPTYETPHFVFHYPPDSARSQNMERYVRKYTVRRQQAYNTVSTELGVHLTERIHFYMFDTNEQAQELVGRQAGRAEAAGNRLFELPGQTPGHELTHVLSARLGPDCRVHALTNEGFSVYFDQRSKDGRRNTMRRALQETPPHLRDLERNFREYKHGYPLAGNFVAMLYSKYGADTFRDFWVALQREPFEQAVETVYGKSVDELNSEWQQRLAKLKKALS